MDALVLRSLLQALLFHAVAHHNDLNVAAFQQLGCVKQGVQCVGQSVSAKVADDELVLLQL